VGIVVESYGIQAFSKSPNNCPREIVSCHPDDLRPHPSYVKHGLTTSASKLTALKARGELAFIEPLTVTRDGLIIDGYGRWTLARESKRPILHCIKYDLLEAEALEWLLQKHLRHNGLNDYSRIMLALDLEPELMEKARVNKQIGGQQKGWSNLTKAEQVHVRSAVAKAANVSAGNVTKVKQLNGTCVPEYKEALYRDEISIHWAWKLRDANSEEQLNALGHFRFEKGLMTEIQQLASRRRKCSVPTPQYAREVVSRLNDLSPNELEAVGVMIVKGSQMGLCITQALAQLIGLEQLRLWNQSTCYKHLPLTRKNCGTATESGRQSATI
jgi:hypothetical protein